ncbi:patatin-like phospholipase family protein [Pseudovibrio exalbescens]|uniref:patatin-like phospholipase family protein n=1 Tax=Pseudovibrio exalbescens TaxID=197461 RepID=UPI0023651367|nr:patatin-like phospholipase family protein [Pseudovibrio exalbescens]MDD7910026.1 patatin-like phospholipase family protein [Pseudovibrio exalbescens]
MTKRKRLILSIDGGGAHGLIPIRLLEALESRLKQNGKDKPLHQYFDLVCGTASGGIIAAGLTAPKPEGEYRGHHAMTIKELRSFFEDDLREYYNTNRINRISRAVFSPFGQYNKGVHERPFEKILKDTLGWTSMASSLTGIMLSAYDLNTRKLVLMTDNMPTADRTHDDYYFWQAVRATISAPGWLEPARVENLRTGEEQIMIDAGAFMTNPVLSAYSEGRRRGWAPEDMIILSIGTGRLSKHKRKFEEVAAWGASTWMSPDKGTPLLTEFSNGQSQATSHQANAIFKDIKGLTYLRLNADLPLGLEDATNTRPKTMTQLNSVADSIITTHNDDLNTLAALIEERVDGPGF